MGSGASSDGKSQGGGGGGAGGPQSQPPGGGGQDDKTPPTTDNRLPFGQYRELFTLRNYWKTVQRNKDTCGKQMLQKYIGFSTLSLRITYPYQHSDEALISLITMSYQHRPLITLSPSSHPLHRRLITSLSLITSALVSDFSKTTRSSIKSIPP